MAESVDVKTKSGICTYTTIILTVLVVVGHVTRMYTGVGLFSSEMKADAAMQLITNLIYSFHMPSFMAVSGAVFSLCINDLGKYKIPKKFIWNKVLRLLIPYFIFLLFLVNPVLFHIGKLNDGVSTLLIHAVQFKSDARHLWFLPVLFGCLLAMYSIRPHINRYPICILLGTLILWVLSFKAYSLHPVLSAVLYYLVFFYTGYLLLRYIDKLSFIKTPWFIICAALPILLLCPYTENIFVKFALNIIGIFFVFGCGWFISVRIGMNRFTKIISRNSFGIYLFHPLLIYLAFYYLLYFDISVNNYLFAFSLIIFVLVCSILLTEGIRWLNLGWITGEPRRASHSSSAVYPPH